MSKIRTQLALESMPIVGIVRHIAFSDFKEILPRYAEAGLKAIEVTLNTPGAEAMIAFARAEFPMLVTGAGTICSLEDLTLALAAGAEFIVTPVTEPEVIEEAASRSVPVFPGAFTASEIFQAWKAGATMVKVFPTTSVGPAYIKDIKGPLGQIPLMPTGGVDLKSIAAFFQAGASAVGIGSKLFDMDLINRKDWIGLKNLFGQFVSAIQQTP